MGAAEHLVEDRLRLQEHTGARLDSIELAMAMAEARPGFEATIDRELVRAGWFREGPYHAPARWREASNIVIGGAALGGIIALVMASGPLIIGYLGLAAAGWLGLRTAESMPVRTRTGALVTAMLKAYRRSLAETLAMVDSVEAVLEVAPLRWFKTPDRMIVWAVALDLQEELGSVFLRASRSGADAPAADSWFPDWYVVTVHDPGSLFRSLDHLVGSPAR